MLNYYHRGDSVANHIAKIGTMAQNLLVEDVGLKFSEEQIISKIITSLPSDYCHVLTARKSIPDPHRIRKTLILGVLNTVQYGCTAKRTYAPFPPDFS